MDQDVPTVSELEMPALPWSNVEKGIQRVGDIGVTLSFKTHSSTQKSVHPKDAPSTETVGTLAPLKSPMVPLFRPDPTEGTIATQLEKLNTVEYLDPRVAGAR